ncbi:DivIVA domain-containing protein [Micromonospora sp. NPDC050397]|uniref:DivIVA domain-containing protein n=1 Tax=Micromonospora sp. NPDC050397 TaxID=3364279 RepID=UPI00384DC1C1
MRRLLRFLMPWRRSGAVPVGPVAATRHRSGNQASGYYRAATYPPLSEGQVRDRQFPSSRRGLDPEEVRHFLHRVANELSALHGELDRTQNENVRIKNQLRAWQSQFAPRARV